MILADMVAWATIVPSTVASPANFQMLSFLCSLLTFTCSWSPGTTGRRKRACSIAMK